MNEKRLGYDPIDHHFLARKQRVREWFNKYLLPSFAKEWFLTLPNALTADELEAHRANSNT